MLMVSFRVRYYGMRSGENQRKPTIFLKFHSKDTNKEYNVMDLSQI